MTTKWTQTELDHSDRAELPTNLCVIYIQSNMSELLTPHELAKGERFLARQAKRQAAYLDLAEQIQHGRVWENRERDERSIATPRNRHTRHLRSV